MKKILSMILLAASLMTLVGCDSGDKKPEVPPTNAPPAAPK